MWCEGARAGWGPRVSPTPLLVKASAAASCLTACHCSFFLCLCGSRGKRPAWTGMPEGGKACFVVAAWRCLRTLVKMAPRRQDGTAVEVYPKRLVQASRWRRLEVASHQGGPSRCVVQGLRQIRVKTAAVIDGARIRAMWSDFNDFKNSRRYNPR